MENIPQKNWIIFSIKKAWMITTFMHNPERWNNSWWFCFCSVIHNKWETLHVCAPCLNCSVSPSSGHELLGFSFFFFFLMSSFPLFCIKALLLAQVIFFRESFKASSKAVACPWDLIQTQWGGGGTTRKSLVVTLWGGRGAKTHIPLISFPFFPHRNPPGQKITASSSSVFSLNVFFFFF